MLKTFTIQIQSALTDRVAEVEEHLLLPDPRYQELNTKLREVMERMNRPRPIAIKSVKGERRNNSYKLEIGE
jgi:hypothetical protein